MILIIAEKPSLARNIAAAIGNMRRCDGYLEGKDYLVSWAFGHLFSLCDIEEYSGQPQAHWTMEGLPCFPKEFRFRLRRKDDKTVDPGVEKQFRTICALCAREDVDRVVNAGDADREGEIIVRLCLKHAGCKKEQLRLWLPDQTEETVRAALAEMKSEAEYDNLANEGFARTYIDWLYGVNLTRYATLRTGTLLRVGRVIVPVVKAIYDRDKQIRDFVPETYYSIKSSAETDGCEVELQSKLRFEKNERAKAEQAAEEYNACQAVVTNVKSKKDVIKPGKLFSLSKLQSFLGKKYKMPMEKSLAVTQKLYEEGYLTYPRTNSEYLATAEKDKIRRILTGVKNLGYDVIFKDNKTIFDDAKIESHSALTPTTKLPDKTKLSEDEKLVYGAVMRRFAAVFCREECQAQRTEITVKVGEKEEFLLKGTVISQKGWMKYDDPTTKDKVLPALKKGDAVAIDFRVCEKETSPPKHYTIETLNNYLKNPFREEKAAIDDNDDEEYRAIFEGLELGTEATRTGIIENAVKSKYIELKKDVYTILPDGEFLIESVARMGISMDKYKTSQMGRILKKIYRGEETVAFGVQEAEKEIAAVFDRPDEPPETDTDMGFFRDEIGPCPLCGRTVIRGKYGYLCSGFREGCAFRFRGVICGRVISKKNAVLLLTTGKTAEIRGFVSKAGKPFNARLKLENGKAEFDF